ncbi:MAG TPA: hypothetical protein DCX82_09640 [Lachnospiraceae bacterium]|nr:hypothetical protein [Lachnospiraceae bacterium]
MAKTPEMIIDEDIKKIYLGNLNTVEFNLKLPKEGAQGTQITWSSDNELFLRPDGSVTRPVNGIGNRKVHLKGIFSYGGFKKEKIYEVHILEEQSRVDIAEVLTLERTVKAGVLTMLPQAVILRGDNGHLFSRRVDWEGGNEQVFEKCGIVRLCGKIKEEKLPASIVIHVKEQAETEKISTIPAVTAMDGGETHLTAGSEFYSAMEYAVTYFKSVNDDEMLYNFRVAAGLDTRGAKAMEGWDSMECLLRGHTTGHYLSALALCYRETKDGEILCKLQYIVEELGRCQKVFSGLPGYQEGYLGAYPEEQYDLLEKGAKYPDIWAPYYTLHKLLAGMLEAYYWTENKKALDIAIKAGMWVYRRLNRLTKNERERMWDTYIAGEFGGINETFASLYEITGREEFLTTAKMFDNDRLFVPMQEQKDVLEGLHANQHIPQIIGCMGLFRATGEKHYYDIAEFFWKTVTGSHTFVNGGTGENEMFFEPDASAAHLTEETAEYCASYNMLKLTRELFRYAPKAFYMDYYERCMFNHIVAGVEQRPNGETTYFFPLGPGGVKDPGSINSCCHGTGMESQMKYTEAIYFHTKEELYVNLFLNSETVWKEKDIRIRQATDKENPGNVKLCIEGDTEFMLKIRCPYWCKGEYEVLVNNGKVIAKCDSGGYININRKRTTNMVVIRFKCEIRMESASGSGDIRAWAYGPYVLAALSEQRNFLELDGDELKPEKTGTQGLRFRMNSRKNILWVPLADVGDKRFHVYWKKVC